MRSTRLPMALTLVFSLLALSLLAAVAPAAAQGQPRRYVLPGDAVFPEGIAYQESTGDFFVSSTTDGAIFRANVNDAEAGIFLPGGGDGRTAATGMKVHENHLYVSGAASGQMFVYDIASQALLGKFASGKTPTFINDVAVTPDGSGYFTDSQSPFLYRVWPNGSGGFSYEEWLDFTGTALTYVQGFNVNGIAASADGAYLILIQSNTGKLFRVSTASKEVVEINIGSETVASGDGIFLRGNTLWVSRNSLALIVTLELSGDFSSGRVVSAWTDASFQFPTTIAVSGNRLFAVNSQFNNRGEGRTPVLPFNVVAVDLPGQAGATPGMPRTGGEQGIFLLALAFVAMGAAAIAGGLWVRRRA